MSQLAQKAISNDATRALDMVMAGDIMVKGMLLLAQKVLDCVIQGMPVFWRRAAPRRVLQPRRDVTAHSGILCWLFAHARRPPLADNSDFSIASVSFIFSFGFAPRLHRLDREHE